MAEIQGTHPSHDMHFNPEGFWMCRKCMLCVCHNRKVLEYDCPSLVHDTSVTKGPPKVRVTLEMEGLSMSDATMVIDALNAVEVPFKRVSSIVEVEED